MQEVKETKKAARVEGTIKSFDSAKRHGFIGRKEGDDIFMHLDAVKGDGNKNLKAGDRVEYELEEGPKGPRAASVRVL